MISGSHYLVKDKSHKNTNFFLKQNENKCQKEPKLNNLANKIMRDHLVTTKGFLRRINYVQETVGILFLVVKLRHGHCLAGHAPLVHKKKDCLRWVQLQHSPDLHDDVANCKMIRDQKLCTRKQW